MSSISSSNPNDPSKIREYYSKRESEMEGKHSDEINSLRKNQAEELEHVRDQASNAVDEARGKMKEKITDQDHKHQADIEALKAIYQKKLEDQAKKG